jgi:DNA mismatch endonuclease (patch repair protein)
MDNLTAEQRVHTMRSVRSIDTSPERAVRRMIFSWGYRYRLHSKKLPGCPDIVFPSMRKAIFIHGCFWHGHKCPAGLNRPKSNTEYWNRKLERNRLRDITARRKLRRMGWKAIIVWECELRKKSAGGRIQRFLQES